MKKIKQVILLFVCILMLSGCVKEHINMTINKDKSMNLEIEMLLSDEFIKQMGEGESSTWGDEIKESTKNGFTLSDKKENGYTGYVVSKKYNNIDDLSKGNGEVVNIGEIASEDFDESKIFKIEKGFLKNTYIAKFKFEQDTTSNELMNDSTTLEENNESDIPMTENSENNAVIEENNATVPEVGTVDDGSTTESEEADFSGLESLASEMEFTYSVKLPYGAISNNATKVSSDKKELTWNLNTTGTTNIEYSFSMLNLTNIIILAGGIVVLIVIIIIVIILSKKKKTNKETLIHTDYDSSIVGKIDETNVPQNMQAGPVNHEVSATENNVNTEITVNQNTYNQSPNVNPNQNVVSQPINMEAQMVSSEPNVSDVPVQSRPLNNDMSQIDIPNMVPLSEMNQNNNN